jgi:hypothetical protein
MQLCWHNNGCATDQTVCLSNLLGLNQEVGKGDSELSGGLTHVHLFTGQLGELPSDMLFANRPPLTEDSSRWIP